MWELGYPMRVRQGLNRTSVGLKLHAQTIRAHEVPEPQSNQRGIETIRGEQSGSLKDRMRSAVKEAQRTEIDIIKHDQLQRR